MSSHKGEPAQGSRRANRSITVLHVEDDVYVRRMLASALPTIYKAFPTEDWPSVQVIEAEDGLTGVAKAKEHLPDVILMDLRLPGLNGLSATAELRRDPRTARIPIVFLTVYEDERVEAAAARAGAQRVLYKPFRWEDLMSTIVEVAGHRG